MKSERHRARFKAKVALVALRVIDYVTGLANRFGVRPDKLHTWKRTLLGQADQGIDNSPTSQRERVARGDALQVSSAGEQRPLRVLITNVTLAGRTGTETVVRDLALGLAAAGQFPMVYSPEIGEIALEIERAGVPVVSDLGLLQAEPDVIHGHHHAQTLQALLHFPKAPAIFVCHDRLAPTDVPPPFPRIARYVAVDMNCRERLAVDYAIPEHLVDVIYNCVDTNRFIERSPLPPSPGRALVFSHYAGANTHLEAVKAACAETNLPVDVVGSYSGNSCPAPESILGNYDLVFAKARCALEAMAVGTAVILCDTRGLGPMVTASEV